MIETTLTLITVSTLAICGLGSVKAAAVLMNTIANTGLVKLANKYILYPSILFQVWYWTDHLNLIG